MKQEELLKNAAAWFTQKYGKTPEECSINFSKVWNKRIFFLKIPTVVFAPSEVEGMAFIVSQRGILRMLHGVFLYAGVSFALFGFGLTYNFPIFAVVLITVVGVILILWNLLCYKRFKRLEKLYEGNIEIYVED